MAREPLEATKRSTMTPARRRAVLMRAGICCEHPDCVMAQALEIDHIIPLELGGADDDTNLQALCHTHHKLKTKQDIKRIAKARRLRKKENPSDQTPRKRQIQSKGFDKTRTRSFSGKVAPRKSRSARPDTQSDPPSD